MGLVGEHSTAHPAGHLVYVGPTVGGHIAPPELTQPGSVVAISVGFRHAVVLKTDLSVASFGVQYAPVPDVVKQPGAVKSISAGKIHTLAILANGSMVQWGRKESATPPPEVGVCVDV